MKWQEVTIETRWAEDGLPAELVTGALMELGITGVETQDPYETRLFLENNPDSWDYADEEIMSAAPGKTVLRFYLDETGKELLGNVETAISDLKNGEFKDILGDLPLTVKTVDDEDWVDNWKQYYKPFRVGKRLVIRPTWETYEKKPGDVVMSLNPGQVFGTGLHQTTRMCLGYMDSFVKPAGKVLDLGCGSGILSIAALLLWKNAKAVAIDIDKAAQKVVRENAEENGIGPDRLEVMTGNVLQNKSFLKKIRDKYDLILANIVADVVIEFAPLVKDMLTDKGVFLASGVIKDRLKEVLKVFRDNGFKIIAVGEDGEWVSISARLAK